MREPLLIPSLGAITGITLSAHFEFGWGELAFAASLLVAILLAARSTPIHGGLLRTVHLLLALLAGIALERHHRPAAPPPALPPGAISTESLLAADLCVVENSTFADGRFRFLAEFPSGARVQVSHYPRAGLAAPERLVYGQRVRFSARYRAPDRFLNPGSFDYPSYLARRNIFWLATIPAKSPIDRSPLSLPCGSPFHRTIANARTFLADRIEASFPSDDDYVPAMLAALLLGDDSLVRKSWTDAYRRTGTFHALVVSGQHLTVLCAVLIAALNLIFRRPLFAAVSSVAVAWTYALLAGAEAPVLRAAGGLTLFALARFLHRRGRTLNILSAIALGFLIFDPHQLFEASFQLSFAAVAALDAIATPLIKPRIDPLSDSAFRLTDPDDDLDRPAWLAAAAVELRLLARTISLWTRVPESFSLHAFGLAIRSCTFTARILVLTGAVQFALALPMILLFHRFSVTGLAANLLVTLPIEAALLSGFAGLLLNLPGLLRFSGSLLELSRHLVDFCVSFEPEWRIPDPPLAATAVLIAFLVLFTIALRFGRLRILSALLAGLALAVVLWHPFAARVEPRHLELTAVDVGQGDGLLLALPHGQTLAIDAPGLPNFDLGEEVISPYLWTRSFKQLDVLVLTHAHADHLGGLSSLLANFTPREIWTGLMPPAHPDWTRLRAKAQARGVRIRALHAGQNVHYGGATFEVLAPAADAEPGTKPHNNDSLVLLVRYGVHSFLLTGDAERASEERFLADNRLGRVDVLKLGHHGSRTSTSDPLLDAVRPSFALVSAGRHNTFRHPHPTVVERLERRHIALYRTDRDGLVTFRTDGRHLTVETVFR